MKNPKTSIWAFFLNAQSNVSIFFTFDLYFRHNIFNDVYFLHISPLPQPIESKTLHLINFFLWQNFFFFFKQLPIFFLKKYHQFWVMTNKVTFSTTTKSTFLGKCHCTNFFRANWKFAPQTKTKKMGVSFIWKLKAKWFQNTLDLHYDKRIWERNYFAKLDNAVLLPPKSALFDPLLDIKPFLTMKKIKSLFQMTYTIRMVRPRQFIEPGLGVSTCLDFGARLFSTQWPLYGANILQGLL